MSGWLYVHGPSILLGAVLAAIVCGVAFFAFVRRAADPRWRR